MSHPEILESGGAAPPRPGSARRVALGLLALIAVFSALFAAGAIPKLRRQAEFDREKREARDRIPEVRVAVVRKAPAETVLTLPGSGRALLETPLYARTSGFLKRYHADIGDTVTKGQVIAEIESPEVDQQLRQARANFAVAEAALRQGEAHLALAKIAADRWAALVQDGAVSKHEADEKQAALRVREADVQADRAAIQAAEANVKRLEELQAFQKIVAPFDGILTARNVDRGTLVSEGSSSTARELFRVAQVDALRVFVSVPEAHLPSIQDGLPADVAFDAHPNQVFKGEVSRSARAVDPASRTMLTEVRVPNPDRFLKPGMYAQVTFRLRRPEPPLLMPTSALLIRSEGLLVCVVGKEGIVHYQAVRVGRDFGKQIEILAGLNDGDAVMTAPSTDIVEGQQVKGTTEADKGKDAGRAKAKKHN
jgi:RND family efflux transporter MFP subunit